MKQVHGFSFIEISFGLLISSILVMLLFQIQSGLFRLNGRIEDDLSYLQVVPVLLHQMELDFSAVFVPEPLYSRIEKHLAKKKSTKKTESEPSSKSSSTEREAQSSEPRSENPPLDWRSVRPFYCKKDEKGLIISCVTTSVRPLFQGTNSRCIQVVYSIEQDKDNPGLLVIKRGETENIFESDFAKILAHSFVLARGLRSCSVRLLVPEKAPEQTDIEKNGEAADEAKETKKNLPTVAVESWDINLEQDEYTAIIPLGVELEASWQGAHMEGGLPCIGSFFVYSAYDSLAHLETIREKFGKKKPMDKTSESPTGLKDRESENPPVVNTVVKKNGSFDFAGRS